MKTRDAFFFANAHLSCKNLILLTALLTATLLAGCADKGATRESKTRTPGEGIPLEQRKKPTTQLVRSVKILDFETAKKISSLANQEPEFEWIDEKLVSQKDLIEKPTEFEDKLRCKIVLNNMTLTENQTFTGLTYGFATKNWNKKDYKTMVFRHGNTSQGESFQLFCTKNLNSFSTAEAQAALKKIITLEI